MQGSFAALVLFITFIQYQKPRGVISVNFQCGCSVLLCIKVGRRDAEDVKLVPECSLSGVELLHFILLLKSKRNYVQIDVLSDV